jgi:hypothetical protein
MFRLIRASGESVAISVRGITPLEDWSQESNKVTGQIILVQIGGKEIHGLEVRCGLLR